MEKIKIIYSKYKKKNLIDISTRLHARLKVSQSEISELKAELEKYKKGFEKAIIHINKTKYNEPAIINYDMNIEEIKAYFLEGKRILIQYGVKK